MSRDWFRSVFIVNLNIPKVFAETMTQSAEQGGNKATKTGGGFKSFTLNYFIYIVVDNPKNRACEI